MKLRQEARELKRKALSSLRVAMTSFNSPDDDGRTTAVLLHLQHSFEMLLKAALTQNRFDVFDKKSGRSIGFEACIRECLQRATTKIEESEAGTLRAIDAMRDDEQHWFNFVSEPMLFVHARAAVTLFDDLLDRYFGEKLADHLPVRVLPISTDPPSDFHTLIDSEYSQVKKLLAPGRRARHEAQARIRTLLAMEAHVSEHAEVSRNDVLRVEKGIAGGLDRDKVFPKLNTVAATVTGSGTTLTVRFSKQTGAPVRYASEDESAAAVREVDLSNKFHWSPGQLSDKLALTPPRCRALRLHLGIDADADCSHTFTFGTQKHPRYSDNAYVKLRDALKVVDMENVWQAHGSQAKADSSKCTQPNCAVRATTASK